MKKLVLLMAVLGLAACAPAHNDAHNDAQKTVTLKPNVITYDLPVSSYVYETRLADGTRCVYMNSINGKAITCEWKPVVVDLEDQ